MRRIDTHLQKYPILAEILKMIEEKHENFVAFYRYDTKSCIIFGYFEGWDGTSLDQLVDKLEKPENQNKIVLNNVVLSERESDNDLTLKKLEPYAKEVCYDAFGKIIYLVVEERFLGEKVPLIFTSKFFTARYLPEVEKHLVNAITNYFAPHILKALAESKTTVKVEVKREVVEPNDRLIDLYRRVFVNKLTQIVNKYTEIVKEVQEKSFKNALKILQSKKILKILQNGIDISVDINPRYIIYEGKRYVFVNNEGYRYKYVRIRLYTDEKMNVKGARVVWWDEKKRGKLLHPQIEITSKDVCLGELRGKDVYYVVENIEGMLSTWNIDSPYQCTMEYLCKKHGVESYKELVEVLTSKQEVKEEDTWDSGLGSWS